MILVDSNILVYAINRRSPKNTQAEDFLQKFVGNFLVAHQNILEALRVLTHPKFPNPMQLNSAIAALQSIINAATIISPDHRTYRITAELIKNYTLKSDQIFDAYLVATALVNDVYEIATDNERDFLKIKEIKVINPFKGGEPKALSAVEEKKRVN